jgi:hypothetical protein
MKSVEKMIKSRNDLEVSRGTPFPPPLGGRIKEGAELGRTPVSLVLLHTKLLRLEFLLFSLTTM